MANLRCFRYSIIFCAFLAAASIVAASYLPNDTILPIHWNLAGEADHFVNKWHAAISIPASAALLSFMMAWLPKLPSFKKNMEHNLPVYEGVWAVILVVLGFAQYTVFAGALGFPVIMPEGLFLLLALFLGLVGNYMPKLKPSLMIGIRTPWTLRNEEVWIKTHRLGGKLLLIAALAIAIAVFLRLTAETIMTVMMIALLTTAVVSTLWSYVLWQRLETQEQ
jgi:uncharacterized membrane protein